ncbi:16S rRNA (uracil(1498)-N(3))-methyltransferase [Leuconostocaceae bacterium ESL0958]|nr:16S rRNA (uracil(1498)-N(3))-methyltransferase [Leuconostocaceae bacterium ESL0958]
MHRYFLEQQLTDQIFLAADQATYHHLVRVLRAKVGTKAELVGSDQELALAEVAALDDQGVTLSIVAWLDQQVELPVAVTIIVSPIKNDRLDWLVQKATELGVARIVVTAMGRTVVDWGKQKEKRLNRLNKIALNAAEQSHRRHLPAVVWADFDQAITATKDAGIVAWEESAKTGEQAAFVQTAQSLTPGQSLHLLFGPEGGLSQAEIDQVVAAGFTPAGLGPRILRAETAPLYALSALSLLLELDR